MKTYLEVADDVFRKGDAYLQQKKERKEKFKKTAATAAVTAVILFSAFGIAKGLLPQNKPVMLAEPSGTTEATTTELADRPVSKTESAPVLASAQTVLPGERTTKQAGSVFETTRTAHSSDAPSQKPSDPGSAVDEQTTLRPDEPDESEPTDEPDPTQPPTDADEQTTQTPTEPVTQPADPTEEPVSDTERTTVFYREENTKKASATEPGKETDSMLIAEAENNGLGWIRYEGRFYVQDNRYRVTEIRGGEKLGKAADFEGNLDSLGFSGNVYLIDGRRDRYLLLQRPDGRILVFMPVFAAN